MPYNTVYVFAAYDILSAAQLNNNDANLDYLKTQADVLICNGRLTLESGVPVSTVNQANKTTLYFTPYQGNKIGLYDSSSSSWDLYTFSEVSLALTGLIKGVVYDIFGYLSGGALALESLAWKKVTASNSPTAGANKVINLSDTTGLAVGMEVTVKDNTNSEVTNITAVNAGVSITVDNLAAGYTTPDVYGYPSRATNLTLNSGIWIKSGDATRRYLGSIRIIPSAGGQCTDSTSQRYVWNMFNRVPRPLRCSESTASWAYTTGTWRASNSSTAYGVGRCGFLVGLSGETIVAEFGQAVGGATAQVYCAIGFDTYTANNAMRNGTALPGAGVTVDMLSLYHGTPEIGSHYLQRMENGGTGATYYGSGLSVLTAWFMM